MGSLAKRSTIFTVLFGFLFCLGCRAAKAPIPAPTTDAPLAKQSGQETAVLAAGCFWGTQTVFERVKGVTATMAGYAGGSASTATYAQVTQENTGHADPCRWCMTLRRSPTARCCASFSLSRTILQN